MKAILEFTLPDEDYEFNVAARALSLLSVIHSIDNLLRNHLKHGKEEDCRTVMEEIRSEISSVIASIDS